MILRYFERLAAVMEDEARRETSGRSKAEP